MAEKPFVLALVHLAPPVTGVSMMSGMVMGSERLNRLFELKALSLRSADSIDDFGTFRPRKIIKSLSTAIRLLSCCLFEKPDLVYFTLTPNGSAFFRDLVYVGILKMTATRRLYHLHAKCIPCGMRTPLRKVLCDWAFKDAKVILLSSLLHEGFFGIVNSRDCFILANGIPDAASPNGNSRVERRPDHPPCILFLSNIVSTKGPLVLLQALSQLRRRGFEFTARFAGDWESGGMREAFLRTVRNYGLDSVVEYCGPKYDHGKFEELRNADLFVFPTCNDTFPLVVLEAMSFSLPVVSTFEGAIPSIVRDNETGYLVPVQNAGLLADRVGELLLDPALRKRFGAAGRKSFEEHFTFEIFERRLGSIFSQCVH